MSARKFKTGNSLGMTLMELLIVVSLISMIGLGLYNALSNGIKVWQKSRQLVIEEDIALFLDKLTTDIRNACPYSKIAFSGNENKFSFPTIVRTQVDARSSLPKDDIIDGVGKVEYYYDFLEDGIFKRQANYGQALGEQFGPERLLVSPIERVKFNYIYITENGEIASTDVLDSFPSRVEVEIEFSDHLGRRVIKKMINVPVQS